MGSQREQCGRGLVAAATVEEARAVPPSRSICLIFAAADLPEGGRRGRAFPIA